MKKKIITIIQARIGSQRFYGKALYKVNGKSILEIMCERLRKSKYAKNIFIATTDLEEDNKIHQLFRRYKRISLFKGDSRNVLSRFVEIAKNEKADIIIRLTGDCPLIDHEIIDELVELFINKRVDYASNTVDRTYPDGLDTEVLSFKESCPTATFCEPLVFAVNEACPTAVL